MTDYTRSRFYGGSRPEYEVEVLRDKIKELEKEVKRLKDLRAYDGWREEYIRNLEETARWNNGW